MAPVSILKSLKATNILRTMDVDKIKAAESGIKCTMESMDKGVVNNAAKTVTPVKPTN